MIWDLFQVRLIVDRGRTMIISKPDGTKWHLQQGAQKLSLRAALPGARVFDLAAEPPQREVWLSLVEVLEEPRTGPLDPESSEAVLAGIQALGSEPYGVEAISKVLALLVPEAVPLMPAAARAFVLGDAAAQDARAFVEMLDWFVVAVKEGGAELASWARAHVEVPLSAAQTLDRLLWFDSEGDRHFPGLSGA